MEAIEYIISEILKGRRDLEQIKREASKRFHLNYFIKNTEIYKKFPKNKMTEEIKYLLKRKPVRTISGVAPIAVMIKPEGSCKHACIYCPSSKIAPKSYIGYEPATRRARDNNFDSYKQVKTRLMQYEINGHNTDKCDIIVMGGTFLEMPLNYKRKFIKGIYDGLNGFISKSLKEAIKYNERAKHRAIGLTIETRPDVCGKKEINEILEYGATKVELGVQTLYNKIYKIIKRGHFVEDVIKATQLLKDSAFKVSYHIMPGLPGSNSKKDLNVFKKLFSNQNFRPDMLKIYPTLVIPGTELYNMYKRGEYRPYSTEEAAEIIAKAFKYIPKYVRVMRVNRDIPSNFIQEGVKKTNLRELIDKKIKELKIDVKEIRTREIKSNTIDEEVELKRLDYKASNGKEIFLSYETSKNIIAFIRLRIPYDPFREEINEKTALIRELRVYGEEAKIGKRGRHQHKGFGSKLLKEAEKIAKEEFDKKEIIVISGVGVREYYYKKGYKLKGPYVYKSL